MYFRGIDAVHDAWAGAGGGLPPGEGAGGYDDARSPGKKLVARSY